MFPRNQILPAQGAVKRKNAYKNSKKSKQENLSSLRYWTADTNLAATGVTVSTQVIRLDALVFGPSGILVTYPQSLAHPYMAGSGSFIAFAGRLRWKKLIVRMNFVGSQANVLASGDLFSRVRMVIIWSKTPYQDAFTMNSLSIDSMVDRRDSDVVLYDEIINLPTTAYDSANGYNCPGLRTVNLDLDLSRLPSCEFFSSASNTVFDTRQGSFYALFVSDSSVAPNPTVSGSTRLYFTKA
jgi:hypothetical protein